MLQYLSTAPFSMYMYTSEIFFGVKLLYFGEGKFPLSKSIPVHLIITVYQLQSTWPQISYDYENMAGADL